MKGCRNGPRTVDTARPGPDTGSRATRRVGLGNPDGMAFAESHTDPLSVGQLDLRLITSRIGWRDVEAILLQSRREFVERCLIPGPVPHQLHEPLLLITGRRATTAAHTAADGAIHIRHRW